MSQVQEIAVRLIAVGLVGVAWMVLYLMACRRADWAVLPGGARRRAFGWQRRAPIVMAWSAALAALGALLVFATFAAEAA